MNVFNASAGDVKVTHLGHASLLIEWNGKNIYTDPYSEAADFSGRPLADLVLLTHHHYDHLDKKALNHIVGPETTFVTNRGCKEEIKSANVLVPGESYSFDGIEIKAVYAYNIVNRNEQGDPFHPRGEGNGYILDFDDFKLYIAGDTELIPEMKELGEIDVAYLPKNLPYTMSDPMFVEAVETIRPKQVFAYHYFEIDRDALARSIPEDVELLNR
jgi:L-ascorbate metabolism protein UlaG (beta-lactamase superfamily)